MDEILEKITTIIAWYEAGEYKDLYKANRVLACNMFFLTDYQIEAHAEYNRVYHISELKSDAARKMECDKLVPELYKCRKIMEAAKGVSIAIGQELKMN